MSNSSLESARLLGELLVFVGNSLVGFIAFVVVVIAAKLINSAGMIDLHVSGIELPSAA